MVVLTANINHCIALQWSQLPFIITRLLQLLLLTKDFMLIGTVTATSIT
jgi:hypothetical protein